MQKILIRGGIVVTGKDAHQSDVLVEDGIIQAVGSGLQNAGASEIDAGGCLVIPGGVDVHTHMPWPTGSHISTDTFASGTRAAAFGGVTTVLDSGWSRLPRFLPATGLTRLETVRVSRAAAEQRAGRAGRLGPGSCYRMWSEQRQAGLAPQHPAEILEADLAPLMLDLLQWGVSDPASRSLRSGHGVVAVSGGGGCTGSPQPDRQGHG